MWFALFTIACGTASAAPNGWPRVSHLADGSSVSVWQSGRVVERDRRGKLTAESYCGSYTRYQHWVEFMSSFRAAALAKNPSEIAARVTYALLWNHGSPWHSTSTRLGRISQELQRDLSARCRRGDQGC